MAERRIDRNRILALTGVVLLSVLAIAFGLAGTASAAEDVSSCTHINTSGTYQLTGDIQPTDADDLSGDTCILINSSDVTLEGAGHTVDGTSVSGTYGIQVENTTVGTSSSDPADQLDRVTIKNVVVNGWPGSVALSGVNESKVSAVEVRNTGSGVFYEYGNITEITDVTATTGIDGYGVSVSEVDDATVSDVTVERAGGSGFAIKAKYSPDVVIDNATIDDRSNPDAGSSSAAAIRIRDSPRAEATNNTVLGVDMEGIRLTHDSVGPGNPNALIADNEVTKATGEGIVALRSDGAVLRDNRLNVTEGIQVEDSTGLVVRRNTLKLDGVGQDGIALADTTGTVVEGNHIAGPFTGIYVPDVDPGRIEGNHVNATAYAIDVEGSSGVDYTGFPIRNTSVSGGDIRVRDYQNVSMSNLSVQDGRVQLGANLGEVRKVDLTDVVITDNHEKPSLHVWGTDDVTIENVSAVDGLDHALKVEESSNATVTGFTVTGQDDSDQNSRVPLVWLTSVDNSSISGLNVSDNPVDGDDASSYIDGSVNALDARHTSDTRVEDVVVSNNSHGGTPAIRVRGDSSNVSVENASVSAAESGAVEVTDTTDGVNASNITIGADGPSNATMTFEAHGVVVSATSAPPDNSQATAIGRYFDATNLTASAFLDVSLHYAAGDVTGVDESTLGLWHHDGTSWSELQGSTVDTGARTISANVTEFSTFGGFGANTPDPADFSVEIVGTDVPVDEGEELAVTVAVENVGDQQGTQTVTLTDFDGRQQDSVDVTLASGNSDTVTLAWSTEVGDAESGSVTVQSENDTDTTSVTVDGIEDWPSFGRDKTNSGHAHHTTGPVDDVTERWTVETDDIVRSPPAVVNGTVYVGSHDEKVYALDADTGSVAWNYTTGGNIYTSPAVSNGTVFVGIDTVGVHALDADTGDLQWTFDVSAELYASPTVVDGTVYFGSDDTNVYALDADTGSEQWNVSVGSDHEVQTSPAVVDGTVYVGTAEFSTGKVVALDADTGNQQWASPLGAEVSSSPAVADDTVYVGAGDDSVYALDAATGSEQWSRDVGGAVYGSPAVADGTVFVGSQDTDVYALDAGSGSQEWTFSTGGGVSAAPAVANDTLYVGSADDRVYALDADAGTEVWNFTTGDTVFASAAVLNGTTYVGSDDGSVYALAEETSTESDSTDSSSGGSSSTGSSSAGSSSSSSSSGSTEPTGAVSASLEDGETSVGLDDDVSQFRVAFSDDAASGSITVEALDERPDSVAANPEATEIAFVDVNVPSSLEDAEASLRLTVSADAIGDADPSSLVVYHYDGAWTPLETTVASTGDGEVVLEATTPGFSLFAIGSVAQRTTPDEGTRTPAEPGSDASTPTTSAETPSASVTDTAAPTSTAPGQPGFGVVLAVAAVALFGLGRRWRG